MAPFNQRGSVSNDRIVFQSAAYSSLPTFDRLLQLRGLRELAAPFGYAARHLFLEVLAVALDFLGADVAAAREDIAGR